MRIKTMQALYAYNANPKANITVAEADLLKSVRGCYALFLWLFALLPEIAFYRTKKLEIHNLCTHVACIVQRVANKVRNLCQ